MRQQKREERIKTLIHNSDNLEEISMARFEQFEDKINLLQIVKDQRESMKQAQIKTDDEIPQQYKRG
jgi:hypothetical protein